MNKFLLSQLAEYPEWQERVAQAMQLPPFKMNYSPLVTEVFDQQGLLIGEVLGSVVYEGERNINEPSKFIAWFFDGKLGVFCLCNQVKAAVAIKTLFDKSTSPGATAYHTAGYTIARSGQFYTLSDKSDKTLMQFDASPIGVRVSPSNQLTTSVHQDLKQLRTSQSRGEEPGGAFARVGKTETEYFARVNAITTALSQYAQRQGTNVQIDGQFSYKWKATPDGKVRIDAKDGRGSLLIKAQGQMKTRMSERDLAYFEQMLPILQQSTPQRQTQLPQTQSQKQSQKQLERA